MNRIRRFIEESWSELKKVTWPTFDQVRNLTQLVFVISAVVGAYIAVFDVIFEKVIAVIAAL